MKSHSGKFLPALLTLVSIGFSTSASAGGAGTIIYGPGSSLGIPTLGGSALIALALLLAIIAFRVLRTQQHSGVNLVVALTAATALASGIGGINLISDAKASPSQEMEDIEGGDIELFAGLNQIFNGTEASQKILSIDLNPGCFIDDMDNGGIVNGGITNGGIVRPAANGGGVGQCDDSPGTDVPPGSYCDLPIACL